MNLNYLALSALLLFGAVSDVSAEGNECPVDLQVLDTTTGLYMCTEVINVVGCNPGDVMVNGNCEFTPHVGGSSGNGDDTGTAHGGANSGPGGSGKSTKDAEIKREKILAVKAKAIRCRACKNAGDGCAKSAFNAEQTCMQDNQTYVMQRCAENNLPDQKTAWGCTIQDLSEGHCPGAEPGTLDKNWHEYVSGMTSGTNPNVPPIPTWTGPGVDNCADSWKNSHPGSQIADQSTWQNQGSVTFNVGQTAGTHGGLSGGRTWGGTMTDTESWSATSGYGSACQSIGSKLAADCSAKRHSCEVANECDVPQ